jgi:predicted DNA-binding transcriptional regulator YafY
MQKQKLLYLQKIMLEKTDENHGLTISEIKDALDGYGIKAERKSLYDDIEILQNFGLDICTIRTNTVRYYVGNRDFQIPELKLLVDAIQSSKFITRKKSLELIDKLGHLVSENEGTQLRREVYVTNRVKTVNEHIYYNVDKLHNAISENKKISFQYFKWDLDFSNGTKIVKTARKGGAAYKVSPWALCWDDENYYLVAYDSEAEMIKHYRVDKMERIRLLKEERDGSDKYKDFNPARYAKSVFSMFGGEECEVKLQVDNDFIGVIVDRFGSDIYVVRHDEHSFTVNVHVMLSPQFYAWLFGLGGKVKILSPEKAIIEFKNKIMQFAL